MDMERFPSFHSAEKYLDVAEQTYDSIRPLLSRAEMLVLYKANLPDVYALCYYEHLGRTNEATKACNSIFMHFWREFGERDAQPEARKVLFSQAIKILGKHRAAPPSQPLADNSQGRDLWCESLVDAVSRLQNPQHNTLLLHDVCHLPLEEIGEILAVSPEDAARSLDEARSEVNEYMLAACLRALSVTLAQIAVKKRDRERDALRIPPLVQEGRLDTFSLFRPQYIQDD